jgi:hypothetical protein
LRLHRRENGIAMGEGEGALRLEASELQEMTRHGTVREYRRAYGAGDRGGAHRFPLLHPRGPRARVRERCQRPRGGPVGHGARGVFRRDHLRPGAALRVGDHRRAPASCSRCRRRSSPTSSHATRRSPTTSSTN